MARTKSKKTTKRTSCNCKVGPNDTRFTRNKAGRVVSAAASAAAKAYYRNNDALKRWKSSVQAASKETGVPIMPSNLKKGSRLYKAAMSKYAR